MEISTMILDDLEQMKDTLYSDFDNFWSYNVLKQELENENTTYVIAKENEDVVGFAGISICIDEATLNNIKDNTIFLKNFNFKVVSSHFLSILFPAIIYVRYIPI